MLTKIILADDEERWRLIVRDFLEREFFEVLEAADGLEAVTLLRTNPDAAVVILDSIMPRMSGLEACREIRSFSQVPILLVTDREDEESKISGMQAGADRYISKPVKIQAFTEQVRSLARRSGRSQELLCIGRLEIDLASGSVRAAGKTVPLTPKEYDLLLYLVRTPNVVHSRGEILDAVWNTDYDGDGQTVDTHVKNLRMRLGPCGELIHTVSSRGYLLKTEA